MFFFLTEEACFVSKKSFVAFVCCGFGLRGRLFGVAGWQGLFCGCCGLLWRGGILGFARGMVLQSKRYGFGVQKVTFWRAKGYLLESCLFPVAARMTGGACPRRLLGRVRDAPVTQEAGRCAGLCTCPASLELLLFNCLLAAVGCACGRWRGGGCALPAGILGAFALRRGYFRTTFTVRPLLILTMFSPFCGPAMARPSAL